ncbi:MAG: HAD family hydrolase [Candidatus Omnitrophota bacterium]
MYKLIIFDLDGTLIDAYPAVQESLNYTLRQCGLAEVDDETIRRTVGWGDRHLIASFTGEERADEAVKIYREHHAGSLTRGSALLPGAGELLSELRSCGYRLAVASNRPKAFSLIVARHLGIARMFDRILCGDELKQGKPHPAILEELLEYFDLRPEDALYVGDMVIDVQTGKGAGVATVAVPTGSHPRHMLEPADPFAVVENVFEVMEIVRGAC